MIKFDHKKIKDVALPRIKAEQITARTTINTRYYPYANVYNSLHNNDEWHWTLRTDYNMRNIVVSSIKSSYKDADSAVRHAAMFAMMYPLLKIAPEMFKTNEHYIVCRI